MYYSYNKLIFLKGNIIWLMWFSIWYCNNIPLDINGNLLFLIWCFFWLPLLKNIRVSSILANKECIACVDWLEKTCNLLWEISQNSLLFGPLYAIFFQLISVMDFIGNFSNVGFLLIPSILGGVLLNVRGSASEFNFGV